MDKRKAMAWFIVIIMVLSVMGYMIGSFFGEEEKTEYKDFNFVWVNNQWRLKAGGGEYYFQYLPQELENLTLKEEIDLNAQKIYLGFQPKDPINTDRAMNLAGYFLSNKGVVLQKACITEKDCLDVPLLNCREKTGIIFISGEKNSYIQDEKCLIITATDEGELEKLTERLIYKWLGVIG